RTLGCVCRQTDSSVSSSVSRMMMRSGRLINLNWPRTERPPLIGAKYRPRTLRNGVSPEDRRHCGNFSSKAESSLVRGILGRSLLKDRMHRKGVVPLRLVLIKNFNVCEVHA